MPVAHYENFPVASWLLPAALRAPVQAIYRFAREADDIADEGDDPSAVRLAKLEAHRDRIERILCDKLDDAIDEYAVRVLGPDEQPLVRFTRCDFADLDLLWQRSVQEFCAAEDEPADQ